jgi:hypothetical protein
MKGFECDFCGKETDGCYADSGNCYCNPSCATKAFEKRMADFDLKRNLALTNIRDD